MKPIASCTAIFGALLLAGCEGMAPARPTTSSMAIPGNPVEGERWLCRDRWSDDLIPRVLFVATRVENPTLETLVALKGEELSDDDWEIAMNSLPGTTGTIAVAGVTHITMFDLQGIDRRWDWSVNEEGRFDDALLIKPNGDGRYLNFRIGEKDEDGNRVAKVAALFACEEG